MERGSEHTPNNLTHLQPAFWNHEDWNEDPWSSKTAANAAGQEFSRWLDEGSRQHIP